MVAGAPVLGWGPATAGTTDRGVSVWEVLTRCVHAADSGVWRRHRGQLVDIDNLLYVVVERSDSNLGNSAHGNSSRSNSSPRISQRTTCLRGHVSVVLARLASSVLGFCLQATAQLTTGTSRQVPGHTAEGLHQEDEGA